METARATKGERGPRLDRNRPGCHLSTTSVRASRSLQARRLRSNLEVIWLKRTTVEFAI
jgi:hypothetical protein